MQLKFNPRVSTPEGIVTVGGSLSVKNLTQAYAHGVFPWPQEGYPILWFSPDPRGILDFKNFHVSTSLKKFLKKNTDLKFTFDRAFPEVIANCQRQTRPKQDGTWITSNMKESYIRFHKEGFAHSLECWRGEDLLGGIYGVEVNNIFSGESMFFKEPNISKLCFWKLVEHLKTQGRTWMDIQMVTPVTKAFGGEYISREDFLKRLGV